MMRLCSSSVRVWLGSLARGCVRDGTTVRRGRTRRFRQGCRRRRVRDGDGLDLVVRQAGGGVRVIDGAGVNVEDAGVARADEERCRVDGGQRRDLQALQDSRRGA